MNTKDSNATPSPHRIGVKWIRDLDELRDWLLQTGSPGPFIPPPFEALLDIYNGFIVIKDNKILAVGPRPKYAEVQAMAAKPPLQIPGFLEQLQYKIALWDWWDSKPGPGSSSADWSKWGKDMPDAPLHG